MANAAAANDVSKAEERGKLQMQAEYTTFAMVMAMRRSSHILTIPNFSTSLGVTNCIDYDSGIQYTITC